MDEFSQNSVVRFYYYYNYLYTTQFWLRVDKVTLNLCDDLHTSFLLSCHLQYGIHCQDMKEISHVKKTMFNQLGLCYK
jgi:hypothetical protein